MRVGGSFLKGAGIVYGRREVLRAGALVAPEERVVAGATAPSVTSLCGRTVVNAGRKHCHKTGVPRESAVIASVLGRAALARAPVAERHLALHAAVLGAVVDYAARANAGIGCSGRTRARAERRAAGRRRWAARMPRHAVDRHRAALRRIAGDRVRRRRARRVARAQRLRVRRRLRARRRCRARRLGRRVAGAAGRRRRVVADIDGRR